MRVRMRNILFGCVRGVVLVLSACVGVLPAVSQVNAEQVMVIGRNVLALDDYMLSIQYFNQAIAAKPYLSDPYYYRGLAKLMLEDYRGAADDCSEAIKRNRFKPEAYRVRGFANMHLREDSAAIADFKEGLRYCPYDKYFMFYKGVAETDAGVYADAETTFEELEKLFPNFDEGLTAKARMHLLASDTTASLKAIERTLEVSKNQFTPYLMRAEIKMKRGDWDGASQDLDKALELQPREADLYVNRAYVRYNADDWFGAMSDYNYALDLEPDNRAAFYNRALLRYRVQDLTNARADFSKILEWEPDNFYARYNRGLINLELSHYRDAMADFRVIATRYPRFYPVYHAMAEVYRKTGNQKGYVDNIFKANEIIGRYVSNPKKYALDRPTIEPAKSYSADEKTPSDDEEFMERFNQLMTVSDTRQSHVAYKEKTSGRVQDIEMKIEPQGLYCLTYLDRVGDLTVRRPYYAELGNINRNNWTPSQLFISRPVNNATEAEMEKLFSYSKESECKDMRPIDYFSRAVAFVDLKNYSAALDDLDRSIDGNKVLATPFLLRGCVRLLKHNAEMRIRNGEDAAAEPHLDEVARRQMYAQAMADFDEALKREPGFSYAWYDKGIVYFELRDYTSALECFNKAIETNPEFGDAYYNRALAYMHLGNKAAGMADLSKAGELGVVPSYNLLKSLR